jgi:hypothetical protein
VGLSCLGGQLQVHLRTDRATSFLHRRTGPQLIECTGESVPYEHLLSAPVTFEYMRLFVEDEDALVGP